MAHRTVKPDTTLTVRRTFAAPRARVFHAWTDPAALKQWWGPMGYTTPMAEVDLRPGGRYRLGMRKLPDGELFFLSGTYREVRPPERLVYTWSWEGQPAEGDTLVTVDFNDRGGSTEVVITHERFPNADVLRSHEGGWNGCLDRLATVLAGG